MKKATSKSPIKEPLLRLPGQSIDEEMHRLSTGKEFPVRPVVLFPGWFVEPLPKGSSVWVLNPQALPSFIQHEPIRIKESDLHMAAYHLARYIRVHAQAFKPTTP
jgi:hypothetical protein